jgi:putative transposase
VQRTFRYRLSPTPAQERALHGTLDLLRELYNAALQERRDAYRATGQGRSYYDQAADLRDVRALRPEFAGLHFHLLQDALRRCDRAFHAFFRRCKAGEAPGYPRFKGRDRYRTFTFPDAANGNGAKLCAGGKRLRLTGIGNLKIKLHRPYEGRLKQISVTRDGDGHWYACLVCEDVPIKPLESTGRQVGIDLGITTFADLSDGGKVENPRPLESARVEVLRAQRRVSRRQRGSNRRRKAVKVLAGKHARVRRVRRDFHHKTAYQLVHNYDRIGIEDLHVQGLARGMLAKQVHDAAWAEFTEILAAKAECAGRDLVKVEPRGTSQECSACHAEVRKTLAVRIHDCPHCGFSADRDHNAARNIEHRLGRSRRGGALNAAADDPRSPLLGR